MQNMVCVVTGSKTYKYMKIEDNMRAINEVHSELRTPSAVQISDEYTCHTWAKDQVQLVVCTAEGDVMVCSM